VVVESIAPEDIRFTPTARDEDKASYLGFIKRGNRSTPPTLVGRIESLFPSLGNPPATRFSGKTL
jgi:hypothetical protein